MPNHVHAIIALDLTDGRGVLQHAPTRAPVRKKPLGGLIGAYKTHTAVLINQLQNSPGVRFWQRNYYQRVIRNERELHAVAEYIEANPLNWEQDEYCD
ncbi:MAG: transposase [Anaerolineales bacterium]|nr:transposase [Anaerolineales bacterium]